MWDVIDRDGTRVVTGFHRQENAELEAQMLNEDGLEEFRPYTVAEQVPCG